MAGTARIVKRMWSFISQTQGSSIEDPFKAFYEEINNLTADVSTLQGGQLGPNPPTCVESGTTSDLDVGQHCILDHVSIPGHRRFNSRSKLSNPSDLEVVQLFFYQVDVSR